LVFKSIDGVLGGYGALTELDVRDSNRFLDHLQTLNPHFQTRVAADGGAGIGRVTKHFLLPRFHQVDMVEQSPRLLGAAKQYIGISDEDAQQRLRFVEVGLQV
jgi:protein N-terminal methyltransferase